MSPGPIPAGLPALTMAATQNETPKKIRDAATQFEALLIAQMLRSAQTGEGDAPDGGSSSSSLIELGQQQLAQALASRGGLGIAKIVIAGLESHANR